VIAARSSFRVWAPLELMAHRLSHDIDAVGEGLDLGTATRNQRQSFRSILRQKYLILLSTNYGFPTTSTAPGRSQ
jgi:hypothetical protein